MATQEHDPARSAGIPSRELRDPSVLRALSHPVRLRMLEELMSVGQATATELAERIGESPANCSWHLRQLAQHGFIEEAGGGTGRQRPWKIVVQSNVVTGWDKASEEPELATARDTLIEVLLAREVETWRAWQATRGQDPPEWQEAAFGTQSGPVWLTAEELAAIKQEFSALYERLVWPLLGRMDPATRPAGSRPVRFVGWGIPSGPPHPSEPPPGDEPAGDEPAGDEPAGDEPAGDEPAAATG